MKSINYFFLLVCSFLITDDVCSQERQFDPQPGKIAKYVAVGPNDAQRAALENVFYPTVNDTCSESVFLFFLNGGWGTVSGMNAFIDLEKAQKLSFTGSANYSINSLFAFLAIADAVGNGMVSMKAYSVDDATGGPDQLLGTSMPQMVSNIVIPPQDSGINITVFNLAQPIAMMDENFFASVDLSALYATGDTLSIWQTADGCGDGADTWELFANNTWFPIIDTLSWVLNSDFLIGGIVEFEDSMATSTDQYVETAGLQLYPANPNPASEFVQFNFGLRTASNVSFEIYSVKGELLRSIDGGYHQSGRHKKHIELIDFTSGSYIYRIRTEQGHLLSKFLIH